MRSSWLLQAGALATLASCHSLDGQSILHRRALHHLHRSQSAGVLDHHSRAREDAGSEELAHQLKAMAAHQALKGKEACAKPALVVPQNLDLTPHERAAIMRAPKHCEPLHHHGLQRRDDDGDGYEARQCFARVTKAVVYSLVALFSVGGVACLIMVGVEHKNTGEFARALAAKGLTLGALPPGDGEIIPGNSHYRAVPLGNGESTIHSDLPRHSLWNRITGHWRTSGAPNTAGEHLNWKSAWIGRTLPVGIPQPDGITHSVDYGTVGADTSSAGATWITANNFGGNGNTASTYGGAGSSGLGSGSTGSGSSGSRSSGSSSGGNSGSGSGSTGSGGGRSGSSSGGGSSGGSGSSSGSGSSGSSGSSGGGSSGGGSSGGGSSGGGGGGGGRG